MPKSQMVGYLGAAWTHDESEHRGLACEVGLREERLRLVRGAKPEDVEGGSWQMDRALGNLFEA